MMTGGDRITGGDSSRLDGRGMVLSPSIMALESGNVQLSPTSTVCGDLAFFLRNTHLLLAATPAAHPKHPHTLEQRRSVLLQSLAFSFFVSAVCTSATLASWEHDVPHDWKFTRLLVHILQAWPFTASTLLQLMWDVSGPMVGIYMAPGFDDHPVWWRWSFGCTILACSVCNTVPTGVCASLGVIALIVGGALILQWFGPNYGVAAVLDFLQARALPAPRRDMPRIGPCAAQCARLSRRTRHATDHVSFPLPACLQMFTLSKIGSLLLLIPALSAVFFFLRHQQLRGRPVPGELV